jgi:hypothetical protein
MGRRAQPADVVAAPAAQQQRRGGVVVVARPQRSAVSAPRAGKAAARQQQQAQRVVEGRAQPLANRAAADDARSRGSRPREAKRGKAALARRRGSGGPKPSRSHVRAPASSSAATPSARGA